jgi:hypothetical protein
VVSTPTGSHLASGQVWWLGMSLPRNLLNEERVAFKAGLLRIAPLRRVRPLSKRLAKWL